VNPRIAYKIYMAQYRIRKRILILLCKLDLHDWAVYCKDDLYETNCQACGKVLGALRPGGYLDYHKDTIKN
jgi:hypothetical protein